MTTTIDDLKKQPKRITTDNQTVENRPVDDLRKTDDDETVKDLYASKKLPIKMFKMNMPGTVY